MSRPGQWRRSISVSSLGALMLVAGGVVAGLSLAPDSLPVSLAPGPAVTSAPVTYETFDDQRQLPFATASGASDTVLIASSGTVTSVACEVGGSLASGDVPLSIDSRPVAAFYTSYPLWRDLLSGDKGADVAAIQSELVRLGYAAGTSGVMDWTMRTALKAFFVDRGYTKPDGSLSRAAILWMPSPQLTISECPLGLADAVNVGDTAVATGGGLVALHPALETEGLAPGARTASFGGLSAPVGEDGVVTDPAFLAAVAASPDYALAVAQATQGTAPQVTLGSALTTPLDTAVVPAGALFRVSGTSGCISSKGDGLPVTIVSSRLGSTYVVIDDGSAPTMVDLQVPSDRTGKAGTCS